MNNWKDVVLALPLIPTRKTIPKALRNKVWTFYSGEQFRGNCFCCNQEISIQQFECGHIIPSSKDGPTTLINLRPICEACNRSMGAMDMRDYIRTYITPTEIVHEHLLDMECTTIEQLFETWHQRKKANLLADLYEEIANSLERESTVEELLESLEKIVKSGNLRLKDT